MPSPRASDQSGKRTWSRGCDGSYNFGCRIKEPLLTEFRTYCNVTGMNPSDVMRAALRTFMDPKVRRLCKRRVEKYTEEQIAANKKPQKGEREQ